MYLSFVESHVPKNLLVGDVLWNYICSGNGDETILILPGGIGSGEAAFHYIDRLERNYKVISPSYPEVNTMDELVAGINTILEHEEISNVNIFGASFGGLLAQCYMKKYKSRVESMILAHTAAITPDYPGEEKSRKRELLNKNIKLIHRLPLGLLKMLYGLKFQGLAKQISGEKDFWKQFFKKQVKTYTKNSVESSLKRMLDFLENYSLTYEDVERWNGRVMILEAEDDHSFTDDEKKLLKDLYKNAAVHTDKGYGHLTTFVKKDLYISLIEGFLKEES